MATEIGLGEPHALGDLGDDRRDTEHPMNYYLPLTDALHCARRIDAAGITIVAGHVRAALADDLRQR
ncbi:MAG TPA: hypothetical protein VH740_04770 [Vicinamibacterales bacterium]